MTLKKNKEKNFCEKFLNIFLGIITSFFSIGISVIVTLNLTIVYRFAITKLNLDKLTGLSEESLMKNYNEMIKYLNNPFINELKFSDFTMSKTGEIHFMEVKDIFMNIYIIILISIIIFMLFKLIKKLYNAINVVKVLNYASNMIISIFGFIIIIMLIDFKKAFIVFHKIFFDNNYWLFDPYTDPIINALPEELFLAYALIIVGILTVQVIAFKVVYYLDKNHNDELVPFNTQI